MEGQTEREGLSIMGLLVGDFSVHAPGTKEFLCPEGWPLKKPFCNGRPAGGCGTQNDASIQMFTSVMLCVNQSWLTLQIGGFCATVFIIQFQVLWLIILGPCLTWKKCSLALCFFVLSWKFGAWLMLQKMDTQKEQLWFEIAFKLLAAINKSW